MKKFATIALAVVLSMGILTGCGSSKKAAEATTEVKEETVDYGQGLNEDGTLEGRPDGRSHSFQLSALAPLRKLP